MIELRKFEVPIRFGDVLGNRSPVSGRIDSFKEPLFAFFGGVASSHVDSNISFSSLSNSQVHHGYENCLVGAIVLASFAFATKGSSGATRAPLCWNQSAA